MRKTQFPRLVIPLAVVLTALFNLGAEPRRGVRLPARLRRRRRCGRGCCSRSARRAARRHDRGVSMIVSSLYPRFRDIGDHLGRRRRPRCSTRRRCSTRSTSSPGTLRDMIVLNPLAPLFELARKWIIDPTRPGRPPPRAAALLAARAGRDLRRDLRARRCGSSTARRRGSPRSSERGRARRRRRGRGAVLGWLAVMERDARLQARGVEAAGPARRARQRWRAPRRTCARRGC